MTDRELLQKALNALLELDSDRTRKSLIDTIDCRIAEPEAAVEPVAWMMVNSEHDLDRSLHFEPQNWHITWEAVPLYLHPPRPVVRLSGEDMLQCLMDVDPETQRLPRGFKLFAHAIEAAVLKKNGLEVKDE